jgi:deoxyribodipyrimidine photo-lyase
LPKEDHSLTPTRPPPALQEQLADLSIPLLILSNPGPRKALPSKLLDLLRSPALAADHLFSNLSYEVDELERDIRLVELGRERGVDVRFVHDRLVVEPGGVQKKGKGGGPVTVRPFAALSRRCWRPTDDRSPPRPRAARPQVYSPWFRTWVSKVNADQSTYLAERPPPTANEPTSYEALIKDETVAKLLDVPDEVEGFGLEEEDEKMMQKLYPPGHKAALEVRLPVACPPCCPLG